MKHRTDHQTAPLRSGVRVLAVALLMLGALIGGAFPSHAESPSAPPPTFVFGVDGPVACPYHASSPQDAQGGPGGGCAAEANVKAPSTVPPVPPVLTTPVGSFVPPWLVDPDGTGPALAAAASAVGTNLCGLCVSRT
ncbi:hypothetical protein LO772_28010 [Yinghuangia sp. ASG 101]|uniref:hypothetical protein n=1 Tax=Yinghuangia sp. ASG 101 TaxID=2896848 RepID=UPI001E625DDA|nr:hypothetical protein [Yinghuangia sp. ASG 101]UGQ10643.1 hypothetical protein LO772_28010 [Yinghuangia sp. ASG 101]